MHSNERPKKRTSQLPPDTSDDHLQDQDDADNDGLRPESFNDESDGEDVHKHKRKKRSVPAVRVPESILKAKGLTAPQQHIASDKAVPIAYDSSKGYSKHCLMVLGDGNERILCAYAGFSDCKFARRWLLSPPALRAFQGLRSYWKLESICKGYGCE